MQTQNAASTNRLFRDPQHQAAKYTESLQGNCENAKTPTQDRPIGTVQNRIHSHGLRGYIPQNFNRKTSILARQNTENVNRSGYDKERTPIRANRNTNDPYAYKNTNQKRTTSPRNACALNPDPQQITGGNNKMLKIGQTQNPMPEIKFHDPGEQRWLALEREEFESGNTSFSSLGVDTLYKVAQIQ